MVIENETVMLHRGIPLVRQVSSAFVIGGGGFGGPKPPKKTVVKAPSREPDMTVTQTTTADQALLYRLSGDYNPLHADDRICKKIGMKRAILHGLCTLGIAANAVIKAAAAGDATRFKSISCRFASPVYPGDTLTIQMWKVGEANGTTTIAFTCLVGQTVVLTSGACVLSSSSARL
ncbi:hypothetical protein HDU91_006627 [Kappamyces sp. JEL0680]|nr:hypothetical protein HDU91_006627 [Kappamyces sp. JEL0680]